MTFYYWRSSTTCTKRKNGFLFFSLPWLTQFCGANEWRSRNLHHCFAGCGNSAKLLDKSSLARTCDRLSFLRRFFPTQQVRLFFTTSSFSASDRFEVVTCRLRPRCLFRRNRGRSPSSVASAAAPASAHRRLRLAEKIDESTSIASWVARLTSLITDTQSKVARISFHLVAIFFR